MAERPTNFGQALRTMQTKLFWMIFLILSVLADIYLPLIWGLLATLPIAILSWWIVYRSGWLP